jgi:hypothetical protein
MHAWITAPLALHHIVPCFNLAGSNPNLSADVRRVRRSIWFLTLNLPWLEIVMCQLIISALIILAAYVN